MRWATSAILPESATRYKARVAQVYPDMNPGAGINSASQLFRFLHEMKIGDLVCYPSKADRRITLARLLDSTNMTPANFLIIRNSGRSNGKGVCRARVSRKVRCTEIGSALSLFQLKNYADEFRAAVDGRPLNSSVVAEDETVALVTEEVEETTKDFVLKKLHAISRAIHLRILWRTC